MRINIDASEIMEGLFADYGVTSFSFNESQKIIKFKVRGGQLNLSETKYRELTDVTILIRDWQAFNIFRSKHSPKDRTQVGLNELDYIEDIYLFKIKDDELTLSGFGKNETGWYDWIFVDPEINISWEKVTIEKR